jgi:phosphoserine phosphatase
MIKEVTPTYDRTEISMNSLYVISAVGKDQPGLVHSVSQVLSGLKINIVDIDARAVRGHFTMLLVVDLCTSPQGYDEMMEALTPVGAHFKLGLHVEPYEEGRRKADKDLMILTVMGIDRPGIVAELTALFTENSVNIESIKMIARGEYIAMEVAVDTSEFNHVAEFRRLMYLFSDKTGLDVSLREDDLFKKPKRVVVFDCDSTIIQQEVIDELAKVAGVDTAVKEMTARAMNGEIDFESAVRKRVRLLKGLKVDQLETLSNSIQLTPGTEELVSTLHQMGYRVGVISGGFSFFTNYLKDRLNLDYVYANELEIRDGLVTGEIKGEIIDAQRKGEIIKHIAALENIHVDQIVAVGDGANDRFMLENAGLSIGFNPKKILKEYSDGIITSDNISGLLYFLGVPDSSIKKLSANRQRTAK